MRKRIIACFFHYVRLFHYTRLGHLSKRKKRGVKTYSFLSSMAFPLNGRSLGNTSVLILLVARNLDALPPIELKSSTDAPMQYSASMAYLTTWSVIMLRLIEVEDPRLNQLIKTRVFKEWKGLSIISLSNNTHIDNVLWKMCRQEQFFWHVYPGVCDFATFRSLYLGCCSCAAPQLQPEAAGSRLRCLASANGDQEYEIKRSCRNGPLWGPPRVYKGPLNCQNS